MVPAADFEAQPLHGTLRVWGTLAVASATFMTLLDVSIANVALPAVAGDLGVSPNQGTWVITSFAVANAIGMPLTGWLARRFGQVRLFVTSILLFVLASAMCGMATDMTSLVAFRALQGLVAAPIIPLSQALILASYPPALSGLAMSIWSMTAMVGPVIGPLLGGWITEEFSWPWIFYINVPVGLTGAVAVWAVYRSRESQKHSLPMDRLGLALLVVWVGSLQLMLDLGKEHDWFASSTVTSLALVAGCGLTAFLSWELTTRYPVVDLRLFRIRSFWAGCLTLSMGYGIYFGNLVLLPLWLQQFMGYTALDAGMVLAPLGVFAILLAPLVGRRLTAQNVRWFVTLAILLHAVALWLRARLSTDADYMAVMLPTLVQGMAQPLFFAPLTTLLMSGVPHGRLAAASGLSNFLRLTGGAIGTSVLITAWESRSSHHHAYLAEAINVGSPGTVHVLDTLARAGWTSEQALAHLNHLTNQQSAMLAANEVFLASAAMFLLLVPFVWFSRRPVSVRSS